MRQYTHDSYDEYRDAQLKRHSETFGKWHWIQPEELDAIAAYVRQWFPPKVAKKLVCHGVRDGYEVGEFRRLLGPDWDVVGTEIAAVEVEGVLVHDFNDSHPRLDGAAVVYSNALDHSPDRLGTLRVWREQLATPGLLLLHWSDDHETGRLSESDCWLASVEEYRNVLADSGFEIIQITDLDVNVSERRKVIAAPKC